MKYVTLEGWAVDLPEPGIDPYLSAALWLIERGDGALIADHTGHEGSVHARVLLETVPVVDLRPRATFAHSVGLGIVLVTPSPETLELLDRNAFSASTRWLMIPSESSAEHRPFQDAWLWAQQRPAMITRAGARMPDYDFSCILSPHEIWALAVRSGLERAQVTELREFAAECCLTLTPNAGKTQV